MKIAFFCRIKDRTFFDRVGFYKQDIDILRSFCDELVIATTWQELPHDADLYYVWWWNWAFIPIMKSYIYRKPVIITGVFDYKWPYPGRDYFSRPNWQKMLLRFALRHGDANIFISKYEYNQITTGLHVFNPCYSPLVIDCESYQEFQGLRKPQILTIAWMHQENVKRKGLPFIIESMPLVLTRHPEARFIFAGDKSTGCEQLEARVRELGCENAVSFPGILSDDTKVSLMQESEIYIQPSLFEGFGLAVLEAMSCGATVVYNPVGSLPEVVGKSGLPIENLSPEVIAKTICDLLDAPERSRALGHAAAQRARDQFSFTRRKNDLINIVRKTIRG